MNKKKHSLAFTIFSSSLGSMIEWYDFLTFVGLNTIISAQFFPISNPSFAIISTVALYAVGYVFRPLGGLIFGKIGDTVGRKKALLISMISMGISTFLIGCVPTYQQIGVIAPICIFLLRFFQGVSLGGEYGNAAIFIAEHSKKTHWGRYTSFVQTTPLIGIVISLLSMATLRILLSQAAFFSWGWRITFWISILLVIFSIRIRLKLTETPLFIQLKETNTYAKQPIKEVFTHKTNFKWLIISLIICIPGGIISNATTIYALFFMGNTMHITLQQTNWIASLGYVLVLPFYYAVGWIHDHWGSKWIFVFCMLFFVVAVRPIYKKMFSITDTNNSSSFVLLSSSTSAIVQHVEKADTFYTNSKTNIYTNRMREVIHYRYRTPYGNKIKEEKEIFLPTNKQGLVLICFILLILMAVLITAPFAVFLIELFPTRVRSSAFGLSYVGGTIFGGFVPIIATYSVEHAQKLNQIAIALKKPLPHPYYFIEGLTYPILFCVICAILGAFYLPNIKKDII